MNANRPKKKVSIIFRDPNEVPHRKGINSMALSHNQLDKQCVQLFTASRDRLIKVWDVNYEKQDSRFLGSLDEHTDWVNQIIYSKEEQIMISCSNDTTIKLWDLYPLYKDNVIQPFLRVQSAFTLTDNLDYVRAIEYNKFGNQLFSISDSGFIRFWDLQAYKLIQTIEKEIRLSTHNIFESETLIPTCFSSSKSGNILMVGFTDESIQIFDVRQASQKKITTVSQLSGHRDMVKAVKISPDGLVALSGSVDGTLRGWDMTMRKCFKAYGEDKSKMKAFHKDSIWVIEVDEQFQNCFTGGRDGKIFKIHIIDEKVELLFDGDPKDPIISLQYDNENEILWFGTPSSDLQCISLKKNGTLVQKGGGPQDFQVQIKGLPWITDYHILANKRYILTNNSDKKVQLWSTENGKILKEWSSKNFSQVQNIITGDYDINPKKVDVSQIPFSWFSADIKIGSISLHLDEDSWFKGNVADDLTNLESKFLPPPKTLPPITNQISNQKNLGINLIKKIFHKCQDQVKQADQQELKQLLGKNYEDYLFLKSHYSPPKEEEKDLISSTDENDLINQNYFIYIQDAEHQQPLWTSYFQDPQNVVERMIKNIPYSMSKEFQRTVFNFQYPEKIGVELEAIGNELPKWSNKLTVPNGMAVRKVIEYYCDKVDISKHVLCGKKELDPVEYVEFCLDSGVKKEGQPVYIVLDYELPLIVVYKVLFYQISKQMSMKFYYRLIKRGSEIKA